MIRKIVFDRIFLVTTFPIALLAFWLVIAAFFGTGFLPFMVLLLLAILTFAEQFSAFEIRRTNRMLRTQITAPARPWYTTKFWSWEGAKERLTSAKAWCVIAYVFTAMFFSSLGLTIIVLFWASVVVLIFALSIITPSDWSWVYQIAGDDVTGKLSFLVDQEKVRVTFIGIEGTDVSLPDQLTWVYTSGWTVAGCFFFFALNIFLVPVLAKHMKELVTYLLGANAGADALQAKFVAKKITS